MMTPVSILDQDFEQRIAALPHDEARASIMEHAIRAQIHERLGENPIFFERLSAQLTRIIEDLRNKLIDAAEACRNLAGLRHQIQSEADIAAEYGLTPLSFAIYHLIDQRPEEPVADTVAHQERAIYRTNFDEGAKSLARKIEEVIANHRELVDWQCNLDVQRVIRRDIKRDLRETDQYTEEGLDALANRVVDMACQRGGW